MCSIDKLEASYPRTVSRTLNLNSYPPEPSGAPKAVQIRILSSTSVEVQWQPPDFLDQNGVLTGYTVVLTKVGSSASHEYTTSSSTTFQHIEGKLIYWQYL